jgi:hypothetical protein
LALFRHSPRIQPPCPITVAIEERGGRVVAYGVVADVSTKGGCVWTDVLLRRGATLRLRMSFASPPEVHTLQATVAWASIDSHSSLKNAYCCGFRWRYLGYTLQCRLRQLGRLAAPRSEQDRHHFERRWVVGGPWPAPPAATSPPGPVARWDPLDPLATLPPGVRPPVQRPRAWTGVPPPLPTAATSRR